MEVEAPGASGSFSGDQMADELDRLTALYGSGLLDDGPMGSLDALVEVAAALLDCPVARLNLVDHDVQHTRAAVGVPLATIPRAIALCDHAIREPEGIVIPDLAADPRFADSPLIGDGIRFYAGVPITAPGTLGVPRPIGALCVTDSVPRQLDDRARYTLHHLGRFADMLIAARLDAQRAVGIALEHERLVTELARQHRVFAQTERMTDVGSWRLSLADEKLYWSDGVYRVYGLPPDTPPDLQAALEPYPPDARGRVAAYLADAIEHCTPFEFEEDFRPATGGLRRVRCIGECERVDGQKAALIGVFQDVTERHRMETALRRDAASDALTGLANRAAFDKALDAAILRARDDDTPVLLALVDLDGFKAVNDTLGHSAGDDVLRDVGVALRALPIEVTLAARIGGDEFALLVEGGGIDAAGLVAALNDALRISVTADGLTVACNGSVGVALLADGEDAREFLARADVALYTTKRARIGDRRHAQRRGAL